MTDRRRGEGEEGFVLHSYPYRETSLLVEAFTRSYGRMTLVARGARRPLSALRGVLLSFQRLQLSWRGKGEVKTLARAEWLGGLALLKGEALLCGFYLNELLMRLLAREDPHEALFERYQQTLKGLASRGESAPLLRAFEKSLLKELGYGLSLERDAASGHDIEPQKTYTYEPERGPIELREGMFAELKIAGQTLLDIARDEYRNPQTLQQAKLLMRSLISHRLEYQPLKSRRVFRELMEL